MKRREGEPWMSAPDYAHSLRGLGVNLVSADLDRALEFQREVLGVQIIYSDADFAALRGFGSEWMIHADHTYSGHPLETCLAGYQSVAAQWNCACMDATPTLP